MVDGVRFPPQADGICAIDPSIIPALALDRVDILADGASATYGSDAIAGVINVVLKRGFDGAITLLHVQHPDKGGTQFQASQLYGRTWDGGDITLTYEWIDEAPVYGTAHSKYTMNYTPWGLDNRIPLASSLPGEISTGKPANANAPAGRLPTLLRRDQRYELHQLLGHPAWHRKQLPRRSRPDGAFQRRDAQLGDVLRQCGQ